jgi:hypothetical protein
MEIVSRRSFFKFYIVVGFFVLFSLSLSLFLIYLGADEEKDGQILIGIILSILSVYIGFMYFKKSPKLIVTKKGITINKVYSYWNTVEQIYLTGKGSFLTSQIECLTIIIKDNKPIEIYDMFYQNIPKIKYFIQEIVINKKENIEYPERKNASIYIDNELFIPYNGNPLFSFRGIFMWLIILLFTFIIYATNHQSTKIGVTLFIICFLVFWFSLNAWMMHYFEISKNYFRITNHYFFWINKAYSFNEIKEIVFETQGKQPNTLRLITNDFNSKVFPAGSLNDKTWLEMKKELESKNIKVRNECITE